MSILSNIAVPVAKLVNIKKYKEKDFLNPRRDTDFLNKKFFDNSLNIEEQFIDGFQVLTIFKNNSKNKHIIFLHGGAYVMKAVKGHKTIIETMAKKYNLKVTFIDYPLAPENDIQKAHEILIKTYKKITLKYKDDDFFLFGDSSGGGLALSFLQQLKNINDVPFPKKTVLMSPWVDVSMSNSKIKDFEEKDPLLPLNGLIATGKQFAGSLDTQNPLISPIYGNMDNLKEIFLIFGTNEILYPDCLKLEKLLKNSNGTKVKTKIGKNLCHDWILAPLKETKETIDEICNFYLNS
mgnify:FL=1